MSHQKAIFSDRTSVILKVLLLSASLSLVIKYVAPSFHITTTNLKALITVLLPSGMMAIALGWRAWKTRLAAQSEDQPEDQPG